MKHTSIVTFFCLAFVLTSCDTKKEQATENPTSETKDSVAISEAAQDELQLENDPRKIGPAKPTSQYQIEEDIYKINSSENPLYGYWVGAFGKNKINIALAQVVEDSIFGHSVCAGNFRAIKGTIKETDPGIYAVNMKEPGDDKYDGEFNFNIDLLKKELTGSWKPYQNTVGAKDYTLTKRQFKYDPTLGDFPQASTQVLDVPEVENLLPEEIEMIRNEIYARHGYSFNNLKIRRIFDAKDWYIPMSVDIREELTDIEAQNIHLLYNYEDYYEEYYDDYGR
ncbi:YARHG domain-containing protein [Fulvivirga ligni]|uniref:YARHG domain-containing protein n=1 Tax=Fulvivirga ligni TaxID=2904246 RepID=UPI001F3CCBA8|nr:YARHG domain-containing protein [Fulvivirga ligni]UII22306.1 YARHG domain-containing protein [Fulvivirga ligni]